MPVYFQTRFFRPFYESYFLESFMLYHPLGRAHIFSVFELRDFWSSVVEIDSSGWIGFRKSIFSFAKARILVIIESNDCGSGRIDFSQGSQICRSTLRQSLGHL
jgi:hypothetical protein